VNLSVNNNNNNNNNVQYKGLDGEQDMLRSYVNYWSSCNNLALPFSQGKLKWQTVKTATVCDGHRAGL